MRMLLLSKHHGHHHEHKDMEEHSGASMMAEGEEHKDCPGMKRVKHVLAHPPSTWGPYMGKADGHWRIVEMEITELQTAHANLKAGTAVADDVMRELGHVAAACVSAFTAMARKDG